MATVKLVKGDNTELCSETATDLPIPEEGDIVWSGTNAAQAFIVKQRQFDYANDTVYLRVSKEDAMSKESGSQVTSNGD